MYYWDSSSYLGITIPAFSQACISAEPAVAYVSRARTTSCRAVRTFYRYLLAI